MKALIFDLDDTLYDQLLPFKKAVLSFLEVKEEDFPGLYKAFRHYSDLLFEDSVSGKIGMKEMHILRMQQALRDIGLAVSEETAYAIQEHYSDELEHLDWMNGAETVFSYCQEKDIVLGIITNGPHLHQLKKLNSLGATDWVSPDRIIISGEVGVTKPDPAIFGLMEERLGFAAAEPCYVGDSFDNDVVGARQAAWQCVWFNHRQRPRTGNVLPDQEVFSMAGLLQWLKDQA